MEPQPQPQPPAQPQQQPQQQQQPQPQRREFAPKPKLSKAERRALQEQQRAAKAAAQAARGVVKPSATKGSDSRPAGARGSSPGHERKSPSVQLRMGEPPVEGRVLQLFSHLVDHGRGARVAAEYKLGPGEVHPAVAALGQRLARGTIRGGNARAVAMLQAFKALVSGYTTPPDKMLSWDLDKQLRPQIQFLIDCRPHCVSMGAAIKHVRNVVAQVPPEMPESEAKALICEEIDGFVAERVVLAGTAIAAHGVSKINDGDVLLTYGCSSLVREVLLAAAAAGKHFRVVVVDSHSGGEGQRMAAQLGGAGISCTYILLTGISYIMREVTKVLLGASALMANGAVLSRVGTAAVAMMGRSSNSPVIICCETYKFSQRVQMDSIVSNELGPPQELQLSESELALQERGGEGAQHDGEQAQEDHQRSSHKPKFLNIRYDLTPIKYVSLVITEVGMIPPTSVPVLLREREREREARAQ
jgi:translation initiation factor eIF-2B subunit delta